MIGDVKRRFPQELLLGAETVAARALRESRMRTHTAIGLHEVAQSRFINAAGEPNPLSAACKKANEAGLTDNMKQYLLARDIRSMAMMASMADKVEELDSVLVGPMEKAFKVSANRIEDLVEVSHKRSRGNA